MRKDALGCILYTVGTSNRPSSIFLSILAHYGIRILLDVRSYPHSRYPHFDGKALRDSLSTRAIHYEHLGEDLGGLRKGGYQAHMETEGFHRGIERVEAWARKGTTALMCAERFPWRCHRRWIAWALMARGWPVVHVLERGKIWIDERGKQRALPAVRSGNDSSR